MNRHLVHGTTVAAFFAGMVCFCLLWAETVALGRSPAEYSARPAKIVRSVESSAGVMELDPRQTTELLIDAVILVESAGDPVCVGQAGERGLMQIKRDTWKQVSARMFGQAASFDLAFDPSMNRRVGRAYLSELQHFLQRHRNHWRSNERELLLGAYNAGPLRVQQAGFDVRRLPASTRAYIQRATALHEYYLAEDAAEVRRLLMVQSSIPHRGG